MNWTSDFNSDQTNKRFFDPNFQLQFSVNFSLQHIEESNLVQQRRDDQNFIEDFVLDAKTALLEIINNKRKIENEVFSLEVNDEKFDSKWKILMGDLSNINEKISKFNLNVKTPLAAALKKRLKKRKAIKNRREKFMVLKKLNKKKIEEKHKIIDKLLHERNEEVEMVKYEAGLKRQADTVLHEVQRKKYEAKKMLNLLVALAKLRELRSKQEEKLGGYCSRQLSETFNKVMTRFQNLWEKQLEVYKLEEKGLKIMLEENTVPHRKDSKFETNILHWEKVLFGDLTNDKNKELLAMPETDLLTLIQVRREWDRFLTTESAPMATSIPLGWVLPPETEDELWKAFTRTSRKIPLC